MDSNQNMGYCHCCRSETVFQINNEWLRDHYICTKCLTIPRQRHLQLILDRFFDNWGNLAIHESSPSNDFISRYCKSYSCSQFFEGAELGGMNHGFRCENLEKLTFADASFDIFITQDVFEHIFDPAAAASEIMRVLKPGGSHVFTAPKIKGLRNSYARAKLEEGRISYLSEAVYHGNPIGDGRALVTWDYGDDFERLIFDWCNFPTTTYVTRDRNLGIDGEFLEVFVTKKV